MRGMNGKTEKREREKQKNGKQNEQIARSVQQLQLAERT